MEYRTTGILLSCLHSVVPTGPSVFSYRRTAPLIALVLLALALLAAFTSAPGVSASELDDACSVPGATPNDGNDDRVAIQNALTSQKCAHLPAGVYDIDSIPVTPPMRRPPMMLNASDAQLFGDGPGTVLAFRGSNGGENWEGIHMGGVRSTLHDLSITTSAVTDTVEQTHAVRLLGPATDAEISRVSFDHPHRETRSGDCIQLVGYNDGREIVRVKIRENEFLHCDRSGVAVHSGTTLLKIVDNRFGDIRNTDLDFEGTGDTSDVLIQHNIFTMSPGPHGDAAVQLDLVDRARVTGNVFNGRGLDIYQSHDVEIDHNEITFTQPVATPVIMVHNDSARTYILDNSITREPSAGTGAVIYAGPHGSGTPEHIVIDGNTLTQWKSTNVVYTIGVIDLHLGHNTISYGGPEANVWWGLRANGSAGAFGVRTTDVHVDGNTFSGALRGAVVISGSYSGAGTLDTSDNVATGATYGIFCEGINFQAGVLGPVTSTGDSWPAPSPADFVKLLEHRPAVESPPEPPAVESPPEIYSDTTAPVLSGVSLSPRRVRVAKAATSGAHRGPVLRFSSDEVGVLTILIERLWPGKRATRAATLTRTIAAGPGSVAFSGPIGVRPGKPATYRLTLTARDATGNQSTATRRKFTIVAGGDAPPRSSH